MSIKLITFCFFGASAILVCFIGIGYCVISSFLKQQTDRCLQEFREHLQSDIEMALKKFRDGMAEQIVQQENKSDSIAKLYGALIDLLRVGKEFTTSFSKGELEQAERMLFGIRNSCDSFAEAYQKQRLHLSDEICAIVDGFVSDQTGAVQQLEGNWRSARRESAEGKAIDAAIKQGWLNLEDRVTALMESMRSEFRKRQPSSANVLMKWLSQGAAGENAAPPNG